MLDKRLDLIFEKWESLHKIDYAHIAATVFPREGKQLLHNKIAGVNADNYHTSLFFKNSGLNLTADSARIKSEQCQIEANSINLIGSLYIENQLFNPDILFGSVMTPNLFSTLVDEPVVFGVAQPELGQYNVRLGDLFNESSTLTSFIVKQKSSLKYKSISKLAGEYDARYSNR
jgi:hypothetical protein